MIVVDPVSEGCCELTIALAQLSRIQIRYRRWFPCLFAKMTVSGMLGRLSSRSARSRHAFS